MDSARSESSLGDLEAASLAEQDVGRRHAHVREGHLGVAVRCIVVPEDIQVSDDLDARRAHVDQDHRLARVTRRLGVRDAHHDAEAASRVQRAGGPVLASVDDVLVAVALDLGLDVGRVARRHLRLGHAERGTNLAGHQRLQPLLLLSGGTWTGRGGEERARGRRRGERATFTCQPRTGAHTPRSRHAPTPRQVASSVP